MKFNTIFLFLFCLLQSIALSVFSQNNFAVVAYGYTAYQPKEVFFGDTDEVYFVGSCNIRGSINNEITWNGYCYTPNDIYGGCSPAIANTFLVGRNGLITKNSACEIFGSWSFQTSGTTDTLFSVEFYDLNTGIIVGQNGKILRTTNNGTQWNALTSGTSSSLYNLAFKPDSTLIACGANGTILQSTDKGITWNALTTGVTNALFDIDFPSNDTGYVVGMNGVMLKTTDAGITWNAVSTGITTKIRAVDFTDVSHGVMVGDDGVIRRTVDGGQNWITFPFSSFYDVFDVKFRNDSIGYLMVQFDAYKTTDSGINWYKLGPELRSVKYLNDTTLIAVGDDMVRKSTDGGFNWTSQHPGQSPNWYDCAFPTQDTGYICGTGGKIMKTTDGAQSFVPQVTNAPTSCYYFGIHFFDKNKGIAVGSQNTISKTSNGGQTWTTTSSSGSSFSYYDVFFVNSQIGWICGSGGAIRKSVDGGATFTSQTSGVTKFLWSIYFLTPLKGFACGESGTLLRTLDGGTTWVKLTTPSNATYFGIAFRDSLHGYVTLDGGYMLITSNGGNNWKLGDINFTGKSIAFRNSFTGYIVGDLDSRLYFDPMKSHNAYTTACKGGTGALKPILASGINILPGNHFIYEIDTTGSDFQDAIFVSAIADTSAGYWYFNLPANISSGLHHARIRSTATSPIHHSITTTLEVYDDVKASITFRNDTLFSVYNPKYLYQWRKGFTVIPGANAYYYVPDSSGGNYSVTIQYGCCNNSQASIVLNSCAGALMQQPQVVNNYIVICDSSAAVLTASGSTTYHWYNSDTSNVVLDTTNTYTTPLLTERDTFYVASYNGVCESARVPIYVSFTTRPNPVYAVGDSVCKGKDAILLSTNAVAIHWYADSSSTLELKYANAFLVPQLSANDTFYVSAFNYQCESKRTAVIAYAIDAPSAGVVLGDTAVSIGDTSVYTYVPAPGNTIQWLLVGGQIIANNDSLTVQWDSTSSAKVGLIERNALGCASDTVWLNVEVDLAISVEEQKVSNFKLSPNPASQQITLERSLATVTESLVIVDAEGRPVMNTKFEAGKHKLSLNIDHLPAGIYYVKGQSNRTSKAKFSIVRH